jgi:tRNA threonylcarbamoyladenosine biosynthesis protein TsaB
MSVHILCIETSTTVCSVCVTSDEKVLAITEVNNGYTHAENLHTFIQSVLQQAGITASQLSAVAVSKGPGSYTGLRIGVSAAKGLCYALKIPLISIDTLQAMAHKVSAGKKEQALYCPMLDARRMEVYCAVYDEKNEVVVPVNALVLDEKSIGLFDLKKRIYFFGEGMSKAKELLRKIPSAEFIEDIFPSSADLAALSFEKFGREQFEDVATFEPFYLKEFLAKKP